MKPLIPIKKHSNVICIHFMCSFFSVNVSCLFMHAFELFIQETILLIKIKCVKINLLQPDSRIVINPLFIYDINLTKELNCTFLTCFNLFSNLVLTFEMQAITSHNKTITSYMYSMHTFNSPMHCMNY